LEKGATLDAQYPPNCLSQREQKDLCNFAFPEVFTQSLEESTMNYTFRIRQKEAALTEAEISIKNMPSSQFHFSYGYCLYERKKDALSKRGWSQQSFVILSELNLVQFFYKLCESFLKPTDIMSSFKELYNISIHEWVWPCPGQKVEL
jgi:hypothetical protein